MPGSKAREIELASELRDLKEQTAQLSSLVSELSERLADHPVVKPITLYDLNTIDYSLMRPINAILELHDDEIIASFPEIEVFGSGTTESEAISSLKLQILDIFEELRDSDPKELGKLPQSWKRILDALIKK